MYALFMPLAQDIPLKLSLEVAAFKKAVIKFGLYESILAFDFG